MKSSVSARLNSDLLDEKYEQWSKDPSSVEENWSLFFEGFELGMEELKKRKAGGGSATGNTSAAVSGAVVGTVAGAAVASGGNASESQMTYRGRVVSLVYNFRTLGHTQAHINPLEDEPTLNPRLGLESFGLSEADLDREASTQFFRNSQKMTLREMKSSLEEIYSGAIGFEFMHIHNTEVRNWIRARIEDRPATLAAMTPDYAEILKWVLEAELFESFLGKKFLGEKRFSMEGGEGAMVLLHSILKECPGSGVKEIEMGMSHRGRLNVLANFVNKSLRTLLYEFTPNYVPDIVAGDGDVKYHLGYETTVKLSSGEVRINLAANPSHLEAVNPVVEGKARARQRMIGDDGSKTDRKQVLPLLIHGDAAFAGQGSVAEVLNLSQLDGYRTGGTIHLIINNQIGFTTMPSDARSSAYATDVAKMIEAPILHVNGEKPLELMWAAMFALEFRQTFGRDVILDMYCYRRQGHNENDQAAFTQPHIYRNLSSRKPLGQLYKAELVAEAKLTQAQADQVETDILDGLEAEYQGMRKDEEDKGEKSVYSGSTAEIQLPYDHNVVPTGISEESYNQVGGKLTDVPNGFELHPTLKKRFIPRRAESIAKGENIDWALGESLAFGSLLAEGHPVRLSGQDCRRGTFSQRHAVFYDYNTRERFIPLRHVAEDQAKFCVYNSLLSEFAVLGFDYGYSLGCPNILTMWEAQFGDFSNGAQVIIDQFITSAESKWQTPSSIVMLLPHAYEGMGPEHSSARLERFLQLCAEKNMIVGNLTTPAQYFHALRRQKKSPFKKPLILMTPKSLLTRPDAVSVKEDFLEGTSFQEIIGDAAADQKAKQIDRVVFCSGKVYYDLIQHRQENSHENTAIVRMEQLYPFHIEMLKEVVGPYLSKKDKVRWVWCQEEPINMGASTFIRPRLEQALSVGVAYAGRAQASSPSEGSKAMHKREQKSLLDAAFAV